MISKIDINKFGPYNNYNWTKAIPEIENTFSYINILYGRNYAGKTSLSRIFRFIEKQYYYHENNFKITLSDNSIIDSLDINTFPYKVRVYNTDFIKDNLAYLNNEKEHIKAFAVLGNENIILQQEISALKMILGLSEEEKGLKQEVENYLNALNLAKQKFADKEENLQKILRDKAKEIKNNTQYFDVPTYNITNIKEDIKRIIFTNPALIELSSEQIVSLQQDIKEHSKIKPIISISNVSEVIQNLTNSINILVSKRIQPTQEITELLNNSYLQEWVRQGRKIHEDNNSLERCLFCNSTITQNLWVTLSAHFNKESEIIRNDLLRLKVSLNGIKSALDQEVIPHKNDLYSNFIDEWLNKVHLYTESKKLLNEFLYQLDKKIDEKLDDVFNTVEHIILSEELLSNRTAVINNLETIIKEHEDKTNNLIFLQKKARKKLLNNEIVKFLKYIDYNQKINNLEILDIDRVHKLEIWQEVNQEYKNKNKELEELEAQLADVGLAANRINTILVQHFGHNHLELKPIKNINEPDKHYYFKIYRGEQEAKNLSDGEKSLLAFCYFITQLEALLNDPDYSNDLIIYIDDPISSLDNGHIFFIFSLIEDVIMKSGKYHQVFISTHNLDFLKYLKRISSKKLADSTVEPNYYLIERTQKKSDIASQIIKMPKYMSDYTTEYHYLFNEMVKFVKPVGGDRQKKYENTYNTFYNIPNNLRKFLEYYITNKFPNSSKISALSNLDKLFPEGTPTKVNRIINENSHLTSMERGWKPLDIPELEKCVLDVLLAIKRMDNIQFEELLALIGESKFNTYLEETILVTN